MTTPGTPTNPLRVAVIGCGPSGFYVAQNLLQQKDVTVEIDMFDRLPTPFGLVRFGVAPDHQKVKAVTKVYTKIATDPAVRYFGNVEFGRDLTLDDVRAHYHQVAFATGAQTDRRLGIPGEDLLGNHPATEFVAWYNGHPDYRHLEFDLSCERAMVVGVGNVAVDVARILCRTPEELGRTDIADYALEALRASRVREVLLVGRRGPAQAAFTNSEIEELGKMEDADAFTLAEEVALDELSRKALEEKPDRLTEKKVEVIQSYARTPETPKSRRLVIRFLVSPVEVLGDEEGRVRRVRLVKNRLFVSDDGSLRPRPTDEHEEEDVGILFRSVGYRGVALEGVPFYDKWGVIPNEEGRVMDGEEPVPGLYAAGWIKRGPTGVIGTNRPDAGETVRCMVEDMRAGKCFAPASPSRDAVVSLLEERGVGFLTFQDWIRLDALEVAKGEEQGRPRVKFVSLEEMRGALGG